MDKLTQIVKNIHHYCEENNIDYVIVGGFSVLVFGRTRMTMDIDIIIDHNQLDYDHFVNHFRKHGFDINRSDLEVLDEELHGSFFEKDTMFRIDLKGVHGNNEQISIKHALLANFNNVKAYFDNPNQLIAHKLKFGSEQDLEDAYAVYYRSQELIDHNLLTSFAANLGVSRELEEFLDSAKNYKSKL